MSLATKQLSTLTSRNEIAPICRDERRLDEIEERGIRVLETLPSVLTNLSFDSNDGMVVVLRTWIRPPLSNPTRPTLGK